MKARSIAVTFAAWGVAVLIFFPILWMVLTSFKTEEAAISTHALFQPTLASYAEVLERADYLAFAGNSLVVSLAATLLTLLLAAPAAYALAFHPGRRDRGLLLWMLSTKMLPPVGVLIPFYLVARSLGLLDTRIALILIYTLMNLPLAVWMLFSFFKEIPAEILEAGRVDGAGLWEELVQLLLPLAMPGIASTGLLSLILCWNEGFWSLNLTASDAAPLTAFIAAFSSPEGLFFAKLSAASTLAVAPILIFGWIGQRQMVRGLTFGAVK